MMTPKIERVKYKARLIFTNENPLKHFFYTSMRVEISSLLDDHGSPHYLPLSKNWGGIEKPELRHFYVKQLPIA